VSIKRDNYGGSPEWFLDTVALTVCFSKINISYFYMSGFMKTVSKTANTKIAGMFLGNRSDSVHKYGHVVLRVLSTLCTLNRSYTMPMQVFEIVTNESNEPKKAKLQLKLII